MNKKDDRFEEEIVAELKADFKKRREERNSLEIQWRLNMNYLMGNQNAEITETGEVIDYGKQYFWQEREVYNQIAAIVETRLAKLARIQANVSVRPLTTDDADINASKFASKLLSSVNQENKLEEIISLGNHWSEVCGTVFYKVVWNPLKGKIIGKIRGKNIYEGDVDIVVCPPFEIFPDNIAANSLSDCDSIIHAKVYSVEKIKQLWGVDVASEQVNVFSFDSQNTLGGLGYGGSAPQVIFKSKDNSAVVLEKYEMPSVSFPNGRHIIVAGDKLLHYGELPYRFGQDNNYDFPFIRQTAIVNTGCLFGSSVIERVIPIQRSYNTLRNKKHELLNRISMGVLAVEDGSIDTDDIEEEGISPGKIIVYRQGSTPPKLLEVPHVPTDFTLEEERLLNEMVMVSGVSDFMKYTQTPANVTSGTALSLLIEQDDSRLSISAANIRGAIKCISEKVLKLYKQFTVSRRLKRLAGGNGKNELKSFYKNELSSDDIIFDTENDISDTPASRRNLVLELLKMGMFADENGVISARSKLKVLEIFGLGNWEASKDIDELHQKKACLENEKFYEKNVDVEDIDNHEIHIIEHTKFLISGEYDIGEQTRKKIKEHIKTHKKFEKMEKQLEIDNAANNK